MKTHLRGRLAAGTNDKTDRLRNELPAGSIGLMSVWRHPLKAVLPFKAPKHWGVVLYEIHFQLNKLYGPSFPVFFPSKGKKFNAKPSEKSEELGSGPHDPHPDTGVLKKSFQVFCKYARHANQFWQKLGHSLGGQQENWIFEGFFQNALICCFLLDQGGSAFPHVLACHGDSNTEVFLLIQIRSAEVSIWGHHMWHCRLQFPVIPTAAAPSLPSLRLSCTEMWNTAPANNITLISWNNLWLLRLIHHPGVWQMYQWQWWLWWWRAERNESECVASRTAPRNTQK